MIIARILLTAALVCAATGVGLAEQVEEKLFLGERFMDHQEWYRAATKFEEAAFVATGETAARAWLRAADAHREANQWTKAALLYREAATHAVESRDLAVLRAGQSYYLGKDFRLSSQLLAGFSESYPDSALADEARAYHALASLGLANFALAADNYRLLAERAEADEHKQAWLELARSAQSADDLPEKSPQLAAVLSLVLPGAGQVYTGHFAEGAMAFTANAIFGLLIWDSYLKGRDLAERPHRGWAYTTTAMYSFIGSSFYFGSLYGAAVSAQRYNKRQVDTLRDSLKDRTVRLQVLSVAIE